MIVLSCLVSMSWADTDFDEKKNRLIGYMLYKQLPAIHYSDKRLDNSLSEAAFKLYLDQLDYQKRFLLQEDVDQLTRYRFKIDDNICRAEISFLPKLGYDILASRLKEAELIAKKVLEKRF